MWRRISKLALTEQQELELTRMVRAATSTQREVRRARIVLPRAQGKSQEEPAQDPGVNRPVVAIWEKRFRQHGLAGLADAKGRGRKPSVATQAAARVLTEVVQPPAGRSRWSVRTMARHAGGSPATVQLLWSANDIKKPHQVRTFKVLRDQNFEAKLIVVTRPR